MNKVFYKTIFIIVCIVFVIIFYIDSPSNNSNQLKTKKNWSSYISSRSKGKSRPLFQKVIKDYFANNNLLSSKRAVNFGSGSGQEDIQLVEMGWEVLGIDSCLLSSQIIQEKTKNYEGKYIPFIGSFEKAELVGEYDLIMSFYALPFMQKQYLADVLTTINVHLKEEGILVVNFFGLNHEFVKNNKAFGVSQKELFLLMWSKGFQIIEFHHKVYKDKSFTSEGKAINWEVLELVARKKT